MRSHSIFRSFGRVLCAAAAAAAVSSLAAAQDSTPAEPPAEVPTLARVSTSASEQLAASVKELNTLRDQIQAEKVPLATELTSLEEKLSKLRRDHDQVTRLVDAGNLEIGTIKAETKLEQDELTYVAALLDEYTRTFESKLNVCEQQVLGKEIDTAKQATENDTLTPDEKFERQTSFVGVTVKRLFDAIGGMTFPGTGVDLQGMVAKGTFAMFGPVALFKGEGAGGASGMVVAQAGSTKPLIRPLEGPLQLGIASLVESGTGLLPFDPSMGGALKALVQKTNLVHVFQKGGPIMWPLLVASVLSLCTVLERLLFLFIEKWRRDRKRLDQFFTALTEGSTPRAVEVAGKSKFFVLRALSYALRHHEQSLPSALMYAQAKELKRFRRGIPVLDTVITLAPLLGLLGTVTGMMGSFSLIGGELSAPGAITGGIAEALIATAFGLGIAITSLLPFNFLNTKLDEARHELESAAAQLELLVSPMRKVTAAPVQPLDPQADGAKRLAGATA
jgi:biopolymer transport protein ExbB